MKKGFNNISPHVSHNSPLILPRCLIEPNSPAAKQQILLELEWGFGVYTMFLIDSGSQYHI